MNNPRTAAIYARARALHQSRRAALTMDPFADDHDLSRLIVNGAIRIGPMVVEENDDLFGGLLGGGGGAPQEPPEWTLPRVQSLSAHEPEIKDLSICTSVGQVARAIVPPLVAFLETSSRLTKFSLSCRRPDDPDAMQTLADASLAALLRNSDMTLTSCCLDGVAPSSTEPLARLYAKHWSSITFYAVQVGPDCGSINLDLPNQGGLCMLSAPPAMLPPLLAALPRDAPIASLELFCFVEVVLMLQAIQGMDALQSIKFCNVERFFTTTTEEETRSLALVPNDTLKTLKLEKCCFHSSQALLLMAQSLHGLETFTWENCRLESFQGPRLDVGVLLRSNAATLRVVESLQEQQHQRVFQDVLFHLTSFLRTEQCSLVTIKMSLWGLPVTLFGDFCLALEEGSTTTVKSLEFYSPFFSPSDQDLLRRRLCQSLGKIHVLESLQLGGSCIHDMGAMELLEGAMRENEDVTKLEWEAYRAPPFGIVPGFKGEAKARRCRLADSINFHVTVNAKGRRLLRNPNISLSEWSLILENASQIESWNYTIPPGHDMGEYRSMMGLSSLFFFIKSKQADLFERAGLGETTMDVGDE